MNFNVTKWSVNSKLALLAFLLGFIAIFMKDPLKARFVSIDASDFAAKIQDKSNYIQVGELADWLIQKKADFKLIDLRTESKFREYTIPSSVNFSPEELLKLKLSKNEKIILYSDDNLQAAQAWFLMKAKRYNAVYLLSGGLTEWREKILFPTISDSASPAEKANFAKISVISTYFGGNPRVLAQGAQGTDVKPAVQQMPKTVPPPSNGKAPAGKAKREGC